MSRTLLLNASYEPLAVISWQRAICLSYMGKAEVIDTYNQEIRSTSATHKMPAVIRLNTYVRRKYLGVKFSRKNIYARDNHKCQYCAKHFPESELSFDHVNPRTYGGITSWENIVTACIYCNRKKGGRNPKEAGMSLLARPQKPSGSELPYHGELPPEWEPYFK